MTENNLGASPSEAATSEELCAEGPTYGTCNILTGSHAGYHLRRRGCLFWKPIAAEIERLAKFFHDTYERLAPHYDYATRKDSAKPWAEVPPKNKRLMLAVCAEVLARTSSSGQGSTPDKL